MHLPTNMYTSAIIVSRRIAKQTRCMLCQSVRLFVYLSVTLVICIKAAERMELTFGTEATTGIRSIALQEVSGFHTNISATFPRRNVTPNSGLIPFCGFFVT